MDFFKAIRLVFRESDMDIDATDMGEGAQNALVLAIFQAYEALQKKGAVFLIEEPEMYLHPHRRRFFYQTLRRLSASNQIIYATHSSQFVAIPEYEEVHVVYRDGNNTTKVKASTLAPTDQLREKLRKEFDSERNELFFARHVILVEGDTEKLALPEYARRLSLDLDRSGCSVVEVGGKRSLLTFAEIVASFAIPLTVVFDTDSSYLSKHQKKDETEYNKKLHALAASTIQVHELNPDYETVLRNEIGEQHYLQLCQKYPLLSKPVRARLIAADTTTPVPAFVQRLLAPLLYLKPPPSPS